MHTRSRVRTPRARQNEKTGHIWVRTHRHPNPSDNADFPPLCQEVWNLVREANPRRNRRRRKACAQARLRTAHALLNQPRVWRQAVGAIEAARQGKRIEANHRRKLAEAQVLCRIGEQGLQHAEKSTRAAAPFSP